MMDNTFRTTRGEYNPAGDRFEYTGEKDPVLRSASLVGEERGYVLGVEDERRRFREKIREIVVKLKARGYPQSDIASDFGLSLEEVSVM